MLMISFRFGSVVEVEKKCNTPHGKPVYKIYFDSLETVRTNKVSIDSIGFYRLNGRVSRDSLLKEAPSRMLDLFQSE